MDISKDLKIDKQDDFNFKIFNFSFLDGDVSRPFPMLYIFRSLFVLREYVASTKETDF